MEEAYEVASATNNMPEICGRICPHDRLCEGNCVIERAGHGTVTIGAVEKYITETAFDNGWVKPVRPRRELDQSVGIVGAGPLVRRFPVDGHELQQFLWHDFPSMACPAGRIAADRLVLALVIRQTGRQCEGKMQFKSVTLS